MLAALFGALGLFNAAPAAADVLVSNLSQTTTGNDSIYGFGGHVAQEFTTGSNPGGYTLTSVSLNFTTAAGTPANLRVELWSINTDGNPDSRLASLTVPASVSGTTAFAAPADTTLHASTSYFVMVYRDGATTGQVGLTASTSVDSGGAAGWSVPVGQLMNSGSWSDWNGGFRIQIRVDGEAAGTTQSSDANLSALTAASSTSQGGMYSPLTLTPSTFNAATTSYSATVPNSITHVKLTPTVSHASATVTVNGTMVNSGSPSNAIALSEGANPITVQVTAEDTTTKDYTVTITRQGQQMTSNTDTVWVWLSRPGGGTVREGESITVMAHMSEAPSSSVKIPITLTPGEGVNVGAEREDYGPLTGITINAGAITGTGTIKTNHDDDTQSELLWVEISASLPSSIGTRVNPYQVGFTILDDDTPTETTTRTPTDQPTTDTGGPGSGGGGGGEPPSEDEEPTASCPREDREILVSFYEMTDGDNWHENGNWNSAEPLNQWHGVETDEDGNVVSLRLENNNLSGDMPTEELRCLEDKELVELALWGNDDLEGDVPDELVLAVERAALREIAEMFNINPEWFEDYEEPFDFEDWYAGVTTDDEGRVTGLDLPGEVPETTISQFRKLRMITTSSEGGGCALSPEGSSAFSLFLLTLVVFAVLVRRRAQG